MFLVKYKKTPSNYFKYWREKGTDVPTLIFVMKLMADTTMVSFHWLYLESKLQMEFQFSAISLEKPHHCCVPNADFIHLRN